MDRDLKKVNDTLMEKDQEIINLNLKYKILRAEHKNLEKRIYNKPGQNLRITR